MEKMDEMTREQIMMAIDNDEYSKIADNFSGKALYDSSMTKDDRFVYNIVKIIKSSERIKKFDKYQKNKSLNIKNQSTKCINNFYACVNNQDYETALELADKCIDFFEKKKDYTDEMNFLYYKKALVRAVEIQREALERSDVNTAYDKLFSLAVKNGNLSYSDILRIYDYVETIRESGQTHGMKYFLNNYSEIIRMMFQLSDGKRYDSRYFGMDNEINMPYLTRSLQYGDYLDAYDRLQRKIHNAKKADWKDLLTMKLIKFMKNEINHNNVEEKNFEDVTFEIDYNWNEEFDKVVNSDSKDIDLIAAVTAAKVLKK